MNEPFATISIESEILCAMTCINEKRCRALNVIDTGELRYCELFNSDVGASEEVVKDEQSVYYYVVKFQGNYSYDVLYKISR